jgi:Tol biopolymer transport system component
MIPLRPGDKATDRKSVEWLSADYEVWDGRFSPDTQYFAYSSNEADVDRFEVFVRPFDASKSEAPGPAVQVSKDGIRGSESRDRDGTVDINWRRDGKELYFVSRKMEVTAVDVTTTPALKVGTPKVLFKLNGLISDGGSLDGQRFVFLMPVRK